MRVVLLLSIFFVIVVGTWMTEKRMAAWDRPILVTIYPIIADEDESTAKFVEEIDARTFDEVNRFINREAQPYGFSVNPAFRFQVAEPGYEVPPEPPQRHDLVAIAWWSLKMRWWSWRKNSADGLITPDIQMFVLYHGVRGNSELGLSVGMRKGRYGIVKAYARRGLQSTNHIVFTHELLHVLGATDKYDMASGNPIFPDGYAKPDLVPLFPQQHAEIMAVRIPLSYERSRKAGSLEQCRIGRLTAREIGFYDKLIP
jgi:hypothetical protein